MTDGIQDGSFQDRTREYQEEDITPPRDNLRDDHFAYQTVTPDFSGSNRIGWEGIVGKST